ncbi:hypothetical protein ACLB2K_077066 [Fragaria x ananassa]
MSKDGDYFCRTCSTASMDTSATTIEWALSELIRQPELMNKVQIELANVVGMERMVEESDLKKLEYLDMVVRETLRLHPVAPMLFGHDRRVWINSSKGQASIGNSIVSPSQMITICM